MATLEELQDALVNADKAGDVQAARALADAIVQMQGQGQPQDQPPQTDPMRAEAEAMANRIEQSQGQMGAGGLFKNAFSLGLNDKITGGMEGVAEMFRGGSFGEGYRRGSLAEQILEERARDRSGMRGKVAEVAGTVGSGVLAKAPAAATAIGRTLQMGREAATLGAIQGAGDSTATSVGGVAGDAATSGLISGGLGAGLGGAIELARPVVRGAAAVGRGLVDSLGGQEQRAVNKVVKVLADDNLTPGKAAARMQRSGGSLLEVADENTMGLGRAAAARPGPGRTELKRSLDASQRVRPTQALEAVNEALGGGDQAFNTRLADMVANRGKAAEKYYNRAFDLNFQRGHSMAFDDLQKRVPAEAVRNAIKVAQAEGRPFGQQLIASIDDAAGTVKFRRAPSLREWHYIQRGLRSAADSAYRNGVGEVGTAYKSLHKSILSAMDEANPAYKMIRQKYATDSQMMEALRQGREIMTPSVLRNLDEFAGRFASMSDPEKEMVRIGLARGLEDAITSTPDQAGNVINKIFGTPQKRAAIKSVFENDTAFRKFETRMAQMARAASQFKDIRTGSRTAFVEAEKGAFGALGEAAGLVADVKTGGGNAFIRAAAKLIGNLGNMDEKTAAEVARILVQKDPNLVMQALSNRASVQGGRQARALLAEQVANMLRGPIVGGSAGVGSAIVANER